MEPDISSFRRQFFTARAAVGCNGPLPGYQVEPSELAPTKPISLGLTNFQQAKPEKEANLPLSPSLEAWLTCQATTLEGKRPAWESLKLYPKLPSSRAEFFEPSNAPSLLRVGQLPPEWHRLVSDQGRIFPEMVNPQSDERLRLPTTCDYLRPTVIVGSRSDFYHNRTSSHTLRSLYDRSSMIVAFCSLSRMQVADHRTTIVRQSYDSLRISAICHD